MREPYIFFNRIKVKALNKETWALYILFGIISVLLFSCSGPDKWFRNNLENAVAHYENQTEIIEASGKLLNPKTVNKKGDIVYISPREWTSGFFPGSVWYLHQLTGDEKWLPLAEKYTEGLEEIQYLTSHHDVGFMIGSSYLNGYRQTGNPAYKDVVIQAAKSLSTRYRPGARVIQSWDADRGWQAQRGWECPVIIDNMMNLELLFEASLLSGDPAFKEIAVAHANTTMEHQFRPDYSCYHVIDYDPETGEVRNKHTAQGAAHESAWSRGMAWALYGYTMSYRYTKDPAYLDLANHIAEFILTHPNMPEDLVPYWDFDAPGIPDTYRDVSAAAIMMSALYELDGFAPGHSYKSTADRMMESLGSPAYRAEPGTNGNFILMHSVGSIPHGGEIDVPLNYADYYFLEGMIRRSNLK